MHGKFKEIKPTPWDLELSRETNKELVKIHIGDLQNLRVPFLYNFNGNRVAMRSDLYNPYKPSVDAGFKNLKYLFINGARKDISLGFDLTDEEVAIFSKVYKGLVERLQKDLIALSSKAELAINTYYEYLQSGKTPTITENAVLQKKIERNNNLGPAKTIPALQLEKSRLDSLLESLYPIAKGMLNSIREIGAKQRNASGYAVYRLMDSRRGEADKGIYIASRQVEIPDTSSTVGYVQIMKDSIKIDMDHEYATHSNDPSLMSWFYSVDNKPLSGLTEASYWYDIEAGDRGDQAVYEPYRNLNAVSDMIIMYTGYLHEESQKKNQEVIKLIEEQKNIRADLI